MVSFLFITAPEADCKTINRALLYMREWDTGYNETFDAFKPKTDNAPFSDTTSEDEATPLPLESLPENVWSGASIEEVESYCLDFVRAGSPNDGHLFAVLDAASIKTETCILASLPSEYYDDDPPIFSGRHNKVRIPWDEIYTVWCNLDIANMNFEEFTEEQEEGGDEQGWFTYKSVSNGCDLSEKGIKKRDAEMERLRLQDYI